MALNLGEIIFTIALILKCRQRIDGDERLGKFLFHARWNRWQMGTLLIMLVGYGFILFKTFASPIRIEMWTGAVVHILLPMIWIIILAWPDSVYEGGIGCDFGYILSSEIENIEFISEAQYRLKLREKNSNRKFSYRVIKLEKGRTLPFV